MRIHAIQTWTVQLKERQRHGVGPGPLRAVATMLDRAWTEPLPILAWLVEHEEGLIVVDTGETARASQPGHFPAWHPYFRFAVRVRSWRQPVVYLPSHDPQAVARLQERRAVTAASR